MRKFYFLFLLFFSTLSFSQNLDWFYTTSNDYNTNAGNNQNMPNSLAIDKDQSVYMAGLYNDKIGFDETNPSSFQLIAQNNKTFIGNCFIAKIDKNKKYLWHKTVTFTGDGFAEITSVFIDNDGNVLVTGFIQGKNIILDPTNPSAVKYNTEPGLNAIFLNKYSKDGNFIFGNFYNGGLGFPKVTADSQNNVILTGQYHNYGGFNTDFDLSNNTYYLTGYEGSSFILKTDKNGNLDWAKYIQGHNTAWIYNVKTDGNDNIVFMGENEAYFDYNGQNHLPNITINKEDYISKIDKDGKFKWRQTLGGQVPSGLINDSKLFDIDTDNSIVLINEKINYPIPFPNKTLFIDNFSYRGLLIKMDENGNYLWHASMADTDRSQQHHPLTVSINSDHSINWTAAGYGIYNIYDKNEVAETVKGQTYYVNYYKGGGFSFLFKFNTTGKLIYNKYKISGHSISRVDKINNTLYFSGQTSGSDKNPDQNIFDPVYLSGLNTFVQKLDKCYTGTPDGDHVVYFCVNDQKKIKDLFPKTSYSNWYDSPLSTTPLSGETVLESKKYYAITEDSSCPFNPTRLEVNVKIFQNPPKLVVPDFVFCNLQNKTLNDLKINNVGDLEFFDENLNPIYSWEHIEANKKYYVRQRKSYSYYVSCPSDLTEFHVYDTSVPPVASSSQTFCKSENPKVSDLIVTGINRKWYNSNGDILPLTTELQNSTTHYVTQTNGTCESAKAEVNVVLNDPDVPTGNAIQEFCIAQNPTLANIKVNGINIKWYDQNGLLLPENTLLSDGKIYFATQTIDNCESSQKFSVLVNINANSLPANNYSESFCDDNTDDVKSINLDDFKSKMIDLPQNYKFEYFDKNNQPVASNITLNVGVNVFDVKITSTLGCFKVVKLLLTLDPKPKLNLNPNIEFCDGQSAKLDAGSGFASYLWSNGETSQTISVNKEGRYDVTVKNASGCSNQGSIEVKKSILSSIKSITIFNNSATINMSETEDFLYSLDNINFQSSNVFSNLENKSYTVFVKTQSGCIIGVQNFTIFSLSNSFTPNSDGFNDFWVISGLENYPNSEIIISDKMGNTVLKTVINGKFQWDGKYLGRTLPTDNYWYVIKVSDGRILQGYVLLKNRN